MNENDLRNSLNEYSKKQVSSSDLDSAENKASNLKEQMGNFKLLLGMFKDGMSGKLKISGANLAIIAGAIMYVVSPLDLVPDIIPVLGWTDDIAAIALVITKLAGEIQRYKSFINKS